MGYQPNNIIQDIANITKKQNGGAFAFAYTNTEIVVHEEALLYPETSFLAEVGGALGMFLGFSFLGLWDLFVTGLDFVHKKLFK